MTKFYLFSRYVTVLLLFVTTAGWSQTKTVTGKVTSSEDGSEIPGVNIVEKGTSNGTITSVDGTYSLSVGEDAVLVFSFVGYAPQEVSIAGRTTADIVLQGDVTSLTEVVVIGYGEIKKRDVTGSVASVKADDFNAGMIASPEQLILGKAAGVQITSSSGEPGAGVNVRIRGTSSVRGGNNPLFVVDGIPLNDADVSAGGMDIGRGMQSSKNPLNFINPSDIESIDILKDASATAIYGSRGANGVVIITTKSGRGKKRQLEYSSNVSFSKLANRYDLLNRKQFLAGIERLGGDVDLLDYGASTDWQDEISRTAVSSRHELSFANNYKGGDYRASVSYDNQEGVIKNSGMKRLTARLNVNHSFLNDKLKIGLQGTASKVNDQAAPITNNAGFEGDLLGATYMANPTWPSYAASQFSNTNANPLALLKYTQDHTETTRILGNVTGSYEIVKGLSFKVNLGLDRSESTREAIYSPLLNLNNGVFANGRGSIGELETSSDLLEAFFNYNKEVGPGNLSAVVGYSYQNFVRKGIDIRGWGFNGSNMDRMVDNLHTSADQIEGAIGQSFTHYGFGNGKFFIANLDGEVLNLAEAPETSVRSVTGRKFHEIDELQSFFGRVNYSIKDKYLFTATFRADGSTRFGKDRAYGYFPSASAAWRLSEETFIPEAFDDLKLRAGFGITGNQAMPHNRHIRREQYGDIAIENGGNVNNPTKNNVTFANPLLQWEETQQLNIGLDFGFGAGKFTGTLDYYRKSTSDLLMQTFAAAPTPTQFQWENLDAKVINNGLEFSLNYYAIDKADLGVTVGFNVSYNTNEVKDFDGAPLNTGSISGQGLSGAFAQRMANNHSLFTYFLREFQGYDANGLAIYNGDFQRYVNKSPIPKYNAGFSLNARYKNWDLSAYLNGQFGHYVYNNTANAYFTLGSLNNGRNITRDQLFVGESSANAPDASTRFLEKGDFVRLQNLAIGYSLKFEDSGIKALRFAATGQNLFVLTGYSGLDPEVNKDKNIDQVPSLGIDYTNYPRAKTLTLSVSATF